MIRRPFSHPSTFYRGFSVLMVLILLAAGCTTTSGVTKTPGGQQPNLISSSVALDSLKNAQDLFNEAVKSDQPTVAVPSASRAKYQRVVELVEDNVLGQLKKPQEMGAYAILAFSQWRLGRCGPAIAAGDQGQRLYETEKLSTNPRDYGMCVMVGGLCVASQAFKDFAGLKTHLTPETARSLTDRLNQAMRAIDRGNARLEPQSDIAIYTHQWQLALVDAAVRIWTSGLPHEVWQPQVCSWLKRADTVFAKFPAPPYPHQDTTLTYQKKFKKLQASECQGR